MFIENTREKTYNFLKIKGRKLDLARFNYIFGDETAKNVLAELKKYQLDDGGFGSSLATDMLYQGSSVYSTLRALRIIDEVNLTHGNMLFKAFDFLKLNFDREYKGWKPLNPTLTNREKAPWLDSTIPLTWPTPTVEILSYFQKYRVSFEPLDALVVDTIDYLMQGSSDHFSSNDLISYLRFYDHTSDSNRKKMKDKLIALATYQVGKHAGEWEEFGNLPVLYVSSRDSLLYSYLESDITKSIDYLIDTITEEGVWYPDWMIEDSESAIAARVAEAGNLTVIYTNLLKEFNFIG